jgi:hypothetical protein
MGVMSRFDDSWQNFRKKPKQSDAEENRCSRTWDTRTYRSGEGTKRMSGKNYPWMKLSKGTKRNPVIRKMPLDQQGVFYNLLQYAGEQVEEGAFRDDDRLTLALEVANEQEDVLDAAIEHLLRYNVLARLPDDRLAFTEYEDSQVTNKDAGAERQRRFYDSRKHGQRVADLTEPNTTSRGSIKSSHIEEEGSGSS